MFNYWSPFFNQIIDNRIIPNRIADQIYIFQLFKIIKQADVGNILKLIYSSFKCARFSRRFTGYRLIFKKKTVNRPGQADKVIEFIDPNSELAKTIDKEYWVKKEVERPKYLATQVVEEVKKAGFSKFRRQPKHLRMWKAEDAKNPARGYGTLVAGTWYWYESWVN